MRDVNYGWLIRYAHANGASFFFLCVYIHVARGLYYGSFNKPRVELWSVGVTIFIAMMATAFLGYFLLYSLIWYNFSSNLFTPIVPQPASAAWQLKFIYFFSLSPFGLAPIPNIDLPRARKII